VIGINTAVAAPRGVPTGQGFAIPSNLALRVAEQLIATGEVRRAYIGAVLTEVSPALARALGLERVSGAVVVEIAPGGPAGRAGLRPEDVIVGIGGVTGHSVSDLQAALVHLEPGGSAQLEVIREGRPFRVTTQLGVVRSGVGLTPDGGG
jgi:S1-C subfamily serine protease